MRHAPKYSCRMCEFVNETQEGISQHERGFHKIMNYSCSVCDKTFKLKSEIQEHTKTNHLDQGRKKRVFSMEEKKRNGFCRFWNHSTCKFQENCKFLHEEAPHCRFQDRCRAKPLCQFFHEELSQNRFLGLWPSGGNRGSRAARYH